MLSINQVTKVIQSIGVGNTFDVTFIKKDGTERTFFGCMLDSPPQGAVAGELPEALPVMVTEDGVAKWRSFRLDSVVELNQTGENQ